MNIPEIEQKWNSLTPRERDAWIAAVVFGVETDDEKIVCPTCGGSGFSGHGTGYNAVCSCTGGYIGIIPNYTTEMRAMWQIVLEMKKRGWRVDILSLPDKICATVFQAFGPRYTSESPGESIECIGKSILMALLEENQN